MILVNCGMKDKLMWDNGAISMNEYQNAIQRVIRVMQYEVFQEEISFLPHSWIPLMVR